MSGCPGNDGSGGARAVLYQGGRFHGRTFDVISTVGNLDGTGFNDRARSRVVYGGTWEPCIDANFGGCCPSYGPGRYPDLGPPTGQLNSLRLGGPSSGGGYWVFCSDADFNGDCRTFGPGDYPSLAGPLNNRISSGRRVSGSYPYRAAPHGSNP